MTEENPTKLPYRDNYIMHPEVTIFTATYNRSHTLERLYSSIKAQTYRHFEWVVVDDGSSDDTQSVINRIKEKANFQITYYYQSNQGKHIAYNRGVKLAKGVYFLSVDSDDELLPSALGQLMDAWNCIPAEIQNKFTGVTGLCANEGNNIIGDTFPSSPFDSDSAEAVLKYNIKGDKIGFHRTSVLIDHPFPEDIPAKFIPEGRVWLEIALLYKTRFINAVISRVHNDTSNRLSHLNRMSRALGDYEYSRFVLEKFSKKVSQFPIKLFKTAVTLNRAKFHINHQLSEPRVSSCNFVQTLLVLSAYPAAYLLYVRDLFSHYGELGCYLSITRILPPWPLMDRFANILKKIYLRKKRDDIVISVNAYTMRLEPHECVDGWALFYPQLFDRKELDFIRKVTPKDGVFMDVGANIGFYSLAMSSHLNGGIVLAVEADPYNIEKIKRNIDLSATRNIIVHAGGVSDKQETLQLRLNTSGNRGGNTFSSSADGERIDVQCQPLLEIIMDNNIAKIDSLKIDIEGFEYKVLKNFYDRAPENLFPKSIVIEILPETFSQNSNNVMKMLDSIGYKIVGRHGHNYMLSLTNKHLTRKRP